MATTYIFAIGGTGARILRPLTMLLAAGCAKSESKNEIVPIIIDYDVTNGDTERAQKLMENYARIQKAVHKAGTPETKEVFFSMPMVKIKEKQSQNRFGGGYKFNPKSRYDVYLDEKSTDITFAEFLKYSSLGDGTGTKPTRLLLESLYDTSDEDDPRAELNLNLSKGFKGCPNIGCIVTREIKDTPEYKNFAQNFSVQNDKILIIGSIFGGTGASGIPMLLDLIRSNNNWAKGNAAVGIIAMLPYFKVNEDENSAISSETFKAKAKAAISAYELPSSVNSQADAIYYIGDDNMTRPFANHEGGKEQENYALFPELAAAMEAMDYIGRDRAEVVSMNEAEAFEFGLTDDAPVTLADPKANAEAGTAETPALLMEHFFSGADNDRIINPYINPLTRLTIFEKFCKEYLCDNSKWQKNDNWLQNTDDKEKQALKDCSEFIKDLGDFAIQMFDWIKEMAGPQRPLYLYHPEESWEKILHGLTLEVPNLVWRWKKDPLFDSDKISVLLGKEFTATQNEEYAKFPEFLFVKNADAVCDQLLKKIESFKNEK